MQPLTNGENKYLVWDRNFLESTQVIANITTPFREIQYRLGELESLARSKDVTFELLTDLAHELVMRLPVPLIELDVPFVIRCRPEYQSNGKIYSNVSELSYNPAVHRIQQGRFNVKTEPVFYACPPSECKNGNTSLTALLESYKELLTEKLIIPERYATLSKWNVRKTFMVINFSLYDPAQQNNISLRRINKSFVQQMLRTFTIESVHSFLLFCRFMSEKASNKKSRDADYLITNAYKKALERYYGNAVKGFVYSSAMSENNGLNVALSKEVIDEGDLEFDGAIIYKIKSHLWKPSKNIYPCSNYVKADEYGNFKFKFNPIATLFG